MDFGNIDGIPRLLDIGQCNDAYSALQIVGALSKALGININRLPLSIVLSWFEQKAVAIALTLLALNIKNVRLGPTLPAFITPANWYAIQTRYGWKKIGDPEQDLNDMLS